MRTVNFGIIGPGNIANTFAKGALMCEGVKLFAVGSRDFGRAKNFAEKYNMEKAYSSYDEVINDPQVDAVYIAVPHNSHSELAKKALNAGKAVLCEKPFFTNTEDARQVIDLAREKKLLLMEAMWTRYLPTTLKAHEWINEGKIGDVRLLNSSFCFCSEVNPASRLFDPKLAGGAVLDIGVYCLSFSLDFGGKLKNVTGTTTIGPTGVDEVNAISMEFENGALASCTSAIRATTIQDAYICGTRGYIHLPRFWSCTHAYLYGNDGKLLEEFKDSYDSRCDINSKDYVEGGHYEGFKYEIAHFAELFRSGKLESPRMTHEDTLTCTSVFSEFTA